MTPATVEELILECVKLKKGNTEFMAYRHQYADWTVEIGNPVSAVMLGESSGEYKGRGPTMRDAVLDLYAQLANAHCGYKAVAE